MASQKDMIKLTEIVIDMLAQNISDDKIISSLEQNGLDEDTAKAVLTKSKMEFDKTLSERLEAIVDRKMSELSAQKFSDIKRDLSIHEDLKSSEQKEYADRKIEDQKREIDSLKAEMVSIKLREESDMIRMQDRLSVLQMSGATQKLLAVGLVILGIFSAAVVVYFAAGLFGYLMNGEAIDLSEVLGVSLIDNNVLVYLLVIVVLGIISIIGFRTGLKIYSIGEHQFEKVGLEFIDDKKRGEEGSIQELVRDRDVV
jgi:hypothetical protein